MKGGQNKELVEALKIRLAYLRGDVMKVCFENKNEVLMDIREITPDLFLEHSCEVLPAFDDNFEIKGKYTTGGNRRTKEVPKYTQIGNAIPPLGGEQFGDVLKEMLG